MFLYLYNDFLVGFSKESKEGFLNYKFTMNLRSQMKLYSYVFASEETLVDES